LFGKKMCLGRKIQFLLDPKDAFKA
jgi:hypothetical protein